MIIKKNKKHINGVSLLSRKSFRDQNLKQKFLTNKHKNTEIACFRYWRVKKIWLNSRKMIARIVLENNDTSFFIRNDQKYNYTRNSNTDRSLERSSTDWCIIHPIDVYLFTPFGVEI